MTIVIIVSGAAAVGPAVEQLTTRGYSSFFSRPDGIGASPCPAACVEAALDGRQRQNGAVFVHLASPSFQRQLDESPTLATAGSTSPSTTTTAVRRTVRSRPAVNSATLADASSRHSSVARRPLAKTTSVRKSRRRSTPEKRRQKAESKTNATTTIPVTSAPPTTVVPTPPTAPTPPSSTSTTVIVIALSSAAADHSATNNWHSSAARQRKTSGQAPPTQIPTSSIADGVSLPSTSIATTTTTGSAWHRVRSTG
jgi:hypothetical protein